MNPAMVRQVVRAAEALHWPTHGYFASWLWREVSSGAYADWEARKALSRAAGYIPFVGYPLTRAGKIDTMSRAEVERELTENPLCRMNAEGRFEP